MAIGDWKVVSESKWVSVVWHIINAILCTYITYWILKDRINWKFKRKRKMAKEKKHWISKAIKKPGALHRQLGVPEGKDIPEKKLKKAEAGKYGKLAQKRADLAKTLEGLRKR